MVVNRSGGVQFYWLFGMVSEGNSSLFVSACPVSEAADLEHSKPMDMVGFSDAFYKVPHNYESMLTSP